MNIVLYQPEIPPNTGNIIRLCANSGARLHLIEPLGFVLDDARLRRAGLDYHELTNVRRYRDWEHFRAEHPNMGIWPISTRGKRYYHEVRFERDDGLLFGPESRGLPDELLAHEPARVLRIPMQPGSRSLNLANTVAIILFEALRQQGFDRLA
jgi:tRNA (cytidine/uridine-2'-O-)-methyltransferase